MKKLARFLLLAMLGLAVPFHAALGVTVGQCRALEHHGDSASHEGTSQIQTHADGEHHSQHSHADAETDSGGAASGGSHCGPCAACCASAAITGFVQAQLVAEAFTPIDLRLEHKPVSIQLTRLDRPPLAL